jgi:hypothetical protein
MLNNTGAPEGEIEVWRGTVLHDVQAACVSRDAPDRRDPPPVLFIPPFCND